MNPNPTDPQRQAPPTASPWARIRAFLSADHTPAPGGKAPAPGRKAERARYENITRDSNLPGMTFIEREPLPGDTGFQLRYELPTDGYLTFIEVRNLTLRLEMQIALALAHEFPGRVRAGCVKVFRGVDEEGYELVTEVYIVVRWKPFTTARFATTAKVISGILLLEGRDGLTPSDLHWKLIAQGHYLERPSFDLWISRLTEGNSRLICILGGRVFRTQDAGRLRPARISPYPDEGLLGNTSPMVVDPDTKI